MAVLSERSGLRVFEKDLRLKITAILMLVVIAALGAAGIISYTLTNSIVRQDINQAMLDSARMTRNLVEVALERRATRIELLSSYPVLRSPDSKPTDKSSALEIFIQAWPIGRGAVYLDTAGNVMASTSDLVGTPNATGTTWFEDAQAAHITFTYVHKSEELSLLLFDSPVLAVSSPVRDYNEQIIGYAVAFTNLTDIWSAIGGVRIETTGHGFLVDGSGELIAGHLFSKTRHPTRWEDEAVADLVEKMAKGHSGNATLSYGGTLFLVTYTPVETSARYGSLLDWAVGVVVPSSEAFAPVNNIALALLGLTIVILIGAGLAAMLLSRSILRPVDELARSAERIGAGDLTGEIIIRTRDQIGTLASSFLRMRDYLRSALGEAGYNSDRMNLLADEQSAATRDVFNNTEEIVESVIILSKNIESQSQKIRKIMDLAEQIPEETRDAPEFQEAKKLLEESEILAEVGSIKAVEIATSTQDLRAATRDVSKAARRLSEMARELKDMVQRFRV